MRTTATSQNRGSRHERSGRPVDQRARRSTGRPTRVASRARSTPGATPLWCFVFGGKIEFSVTVEGGSIHLYVMDTDKEIVFADADGLTAWLRTNRAAALQDPTERPSRKSRFRKLTEWN